mgnify:CR=1 FL=1
MNGIYYQLNLRSVFISYYYTIAYMLNGRKVIAKILEIKKK